MLLPAVTNGTVEGTNRLATGIRAIDRIGWEGRPGEAARPYVRCLGFGHINRARGTRVGNGERPRCIGEANLQSLHR